MASPECRPHGGFPDRLWIREVVRAIRMADYSNLEVIRFDGVRGPLNWLEQTLLTGLCAQFHLRRLTGSSMCAPPLLSTWAAGALVADFPQGTDGWSDPLVRRAMVVIHERACDGRLTLRVVANAVHASVWNVSRRFRRQTGLTLPGYIHRTRIDIARRLLMNPHLTVKEVAVRIGYDRTSAFDRHFREHCGCTPTEYRSGRNQK